MMYRATLHLHYVKVFMIYAISSLKNVVNTNKCSRTEVKNRMNVVLLLTFEEIVPEFNDISKMFIVTLICGARKIF